MSAPATNAFSPSPVTIMPRTSVVGSQLLEGVVELADGVGVQGVELVGRETIDGGAAVGPLHPDGL
jgi:hypothetical protein